MAMSSPIRGLRNPEPSGRGIRDVNQQILQEGAAGQRAGGIWGRASARTADAAAIGASLDTQVDAAQILGAEGTPAVPEGPSGTPGAGLARQSMDMGSAPMAPTPMVEPGIHEEAQQTPYVPFSPPPARVTSPLSSSPKIRVTGADTADVDTLSAGNHLAHALRTSLGAARVSVTTNEIGRSTRLDLLVDREMRAESRLHHG